MSGLMGSVSVKLLPMFSFMKQLKAIQATRFQPKMIKKKCIYIFFLCLTFISCSSLKQTKKNLNSWLGQPESNLIQDYGVWLSYMAMMYDRHIGLLYMMKFWVWLRRAQSRHKYYVSIATTTRIFTLMFDHRASLGPK